MKKIPAPKIRSRLRPLLTVAALLALNILSAHAQGTGFSSTDLKTGISNSLAVIMMFGFVLGISAVIYGGHAIRRGDVDQGKMSIIGGAIIAAAPRKSFSPFTKSSASTPTAPSASAASEGGAFSQLLKPALNHNAHEHQKRTSPDRHQRRVRFQGPDVGFGRRSLLVAHRRHRLGHQFCSLSCSSSLTNHS